MNALRGRPLWISASAASAGEKPAGDIGALQTLFTLVAAFTWSAGCSSGSR